MPEHIERTQYLRVMGRLYPDRQMALRTGYLTETPPWSDREGDSPLRAEIFDDNGAAAGQFSPARLRALHGGGRGPAAPIRPRLCALPSSRPTPGIQLSRSAGPRDFPQ